jgi:hypothetical protein
MSRSLSKIGDQIGQPSVYGWFVWKDKWLPGQFCVSFNLEGKEMKD